MANLNATGTNHSVLRVLVVEDSPPDAELMIATLKRAGFPMSFEVVDEPADFERALAQFSPDLVLCDHNLRSWTGFDALAALKRSGRDVPLIVVTATLGDDAAVDYIKQGASEYVLKHRLERLPLAVRSALRDQAHRRESVRLQEQIVSANREWELTFDGVSNPIMVVDTESMVQRANRAASELAGKKFSEIIGRSCEEVARCRDGDGAHCPLELLMEKGHDASRDFYQPDSGRWFECAVSPRSDPDGSLKGAIIILHEFTARQRAEQALRESEERFRQLAENIEEVFYVEGPDGSPVEYVSPAYEKVWARSREELYADPSSWQESVHPDDRPHIRELVEQMARGGEPRECEFRIVRPDGGVRWIWDRAFMVRNEAGEARRIVGFAADVTARKQTEFQVTEQLEELRRWHQATLNREGRILELKREVNELLREAARPIRYPSADSQEERSSDAA